MSRLGAGCDQRLDLGSCHSNAYTNGGIKASGGCDSLDQGVNGITKGDYCLR